MCYREICEICPSLHLYLSLSLGISPYSSLCFSHPHFCLTSYSFNFTSSELRFLALYCFTIDNASPVLSSPPPPPPHLPQTQSQGIQLQGIFNLIKRLAVAFSNLPQTYYNTRQIVTTREMFGDSTVTQQCFHASHLMESFDGVI